MAAVALAASACGSSSSGTTTTSSPAPGSTTTTAAGGSSTTAPAGGSGAITKIEQTLGSGQVATFDATYNVTNTTAGVTENSTLTLAHDGSDSLVGATEKSGTFEEITKGTTAVVCTKSTGNWQCLTGPEAGSAAVALTSLVDVFGSKAALAVLKGDAPNAADVTTSSSTFAGQPVTCVSFHSPSNGGVYTYCVTSAGVLAESIGTSSSGTYKMVLTNYSSTPPSSAFTPPATPIST